jgi:plasmid stabilization system protein ParE
MSFRVVYDSEATFEFREAVAWYETRSEELGVRFILEVDRVVAAISEQPFRFSKAGRNARKAKVPDPWPYSVYYVINREHLEIKVLAIWHGSRNPAALRRRLSRKI